MCRELIYSLFIVLVLGLFGNALAEVNYEYYVQEPDGFPDIGGAWMPDFTIMTPLAAGQVGNFDISVRTQNEHFAFRFTGYLGIRTDGDYEFWSESDDGSQLFIGPTLVVDNPGWHGSPGGGAYGTTYLTRGFHEIVVTMFEHEGGEALTVYYQGPGIDRQIIPAAVLVIDPDFPASPYPADDARRVSINTVLAWAPGNSATSHKVYLGTWEPPTYQLTQAGSTFDPGALEYLTDYYWQIVETAGGTDWAGPAWHLKTEPDPATITDVDLLAWYKFDGDYTDSSGYGNHGSPYGSAIGFVSDPERGQVAAFNGSDDCVDLGVNPYFNPAGSFSISVWANIEAWTGTWGNVLVGKRGEDGVSWQLRRFGGDPQLSFTTRGVGADDTRSNSTPTFGEWQHIAAVYDNAANTKHIYLDGIEDVVQTTNAGATVTPCAHNVYIGARATADNTGREGFFLGMLDEVRIYSKALTPAEVENLAIPLLASRPDPEDGSVTAPGIQITTDNLSMVLKYEPGKGAVSHTGYFSENYDDVLDRVAGANLGEPPYLEHEMNDYYVGYDDPANIPAFACVSLVRGRTYYWAVDEFDGATTWPGMVWSFTVMTEEAWDPTPADGAKYVIADAGATLSWNMGDVDTKDNDVTYEVYFGTDEAVVETSTTPVVSLKDPTSTYTTGPLLKDTVYYWRVDTKVALSGPPFTFKKRVKGTVWSFTTFPDIPITDPTLVGWWTFDRGYGTTAFDWSGHGNHGTLTGDPQWVPGQVGGALDFDGSGDYIYTGKNAAALGVSGNNPKTVTAWVYTRSFNNGGIFDLGARSDGQDFCLRTLTSNNDWRVQYWGGAFDHNFNYTSVNEWVHFAVVYTGTQSTVYANGVSVSSESRTLDTSNDNPFQIGCYGWQNNYFDGLIDELRLYSRALSQAEIVHIMDPTKAYYPRPADGEMDVALNATLIWSPGTDLDTGSDYTKHDLYLGTDFDDVNSATVPTITLTDVNEFTPPALDYYGRYYWRVDEVNAGGEEIRGNVWSFKAVYNPALVVDPNLLAWYKLDGDPCDSSGYGRDGTEMGGPSYVGGFDGDAINFDGVDDYVNVETPVGISGNAPRTIAGWAKANADVATLGWTNVFGFCPAWHGTGQYFDIEKRGGQNQYSIHVHGADWPLLDVDLEWHHFAATYNGTDGSAYVDGQWVVTVGGGGATLETVDNVRMGHRPTEGTYFPGSVDDVRIYDYALSAEEIGKIMRGNLAWAWSPKPGNGETGVDREPTLSWKPGDYAPPSNGHYVYFGADDPANLAPVGPQPQSPNNYSPGALDLDRTYYWAVDEANDTAPGRVDAGRIWSFTTIDHLVVDDMEVDYVVWGNPGLYVCQVWVDGSGDCSAIPGNGTGSLLGLETTISYPDGFEQSMKLEYDNDGTTYNFCTQMNQTSLTYSMIKAEVANLPSGIGSDWTATGAKALSLWFYGSTGNSIESMWLELTDGAGGKATVTYGDYADEDPCDIDKTSWYQWNINLQDFDDGGVNLANVSSIAIGIGNPDAPGGSGLIYFDDIRLYAPRCILSRREADFALVDFAPEGDPNGDCVIDYKDLDVMSRDWLDGDETIYATPPGDANLVVHYEFSGDFKDSSANAIDGDPCNGASTLYDAGRASDVVFFDGADDYVNCATDPLLDITDAITITVWMNHSSADTTTDDRGVVGHGGGWDDYGYTLWMHPSNDGRAIRPELNGPADKAEVLSNMRPAKDEWHHVAFTWPSQGSADLMTIYVNAESVSSGPFTGPIGTSTYSLRIGDYSGDPAQNRYFNGMLDDVRIYNKALSPQEIVSTMGVSEIYHPLTSAANISDNEAEGSRKVNFKDYAELMNVWLDEDMFP